MGGQANKRYTQRNFIESRYSCLVGVVMCPGEGLGPGSDFVSLVH